MADVGKMTPAIEYIRSRFKAFIFSVGEEITGELLIVGLANRPRWYTPSLRLWWQLEIKSMFPA